MNRALTTGTMNTDVMIMPDYSGSASIIEPEKMSPMDSLKAIFEDMRDSLNTLVDLAYAQAPTAADMRDEGIAEADVIPDPADTDSQGNSSFPTFEKPEIGPKVGLALMLLGLTALFKYGDEIAAALEPLLKSGKEFYDSLSPEGKIGLGMAGLAALIFPKTLTSIVKTGLGLAFDGLKLGFSGMKTAVEKMPDLIKNAYTGGKNLITAGFTKLAAGFQLMRTFLIEKAYPAILSAFGGVKGKVFGAITKLGAAFTAMKAFLLTTMIPAITAFMGPFLVPLALLTAAVAVAVAVFTSIKAGIDEFKKSLDEGDSMLVAIIEGVSTALLTLVTLPITLIKNFVAWVAEKLGFEGIAEKLKEINIVDSIKNGIKNIVMKAVDFVTGLFDIDFNEVLGKFVDIGSAIGRVLKGIALGSIAAVKAAFPGGESPMEAFKRVYDEVSNKGNENPTLSDEADIGTDTVDADMVVASEIKPEIAKKALELQETNSAGTVITTVNNTDASNTNNTSNTTTNAPGLAVTGTDSTAKALSYAGYGEVF